MARRNLEVVVTVRDAASARLDKIGKKIRETGDAAKKADIDFTQFNKTLFTTGAFVATFVKSFGALGQSLDQGAQLDRLSNQYERVFGPKGKLHEALVNTTTTTIDETLAMQEGLKLASLGIIKDQNELADVLGRAGTAAKMMGMDSSEGVKRFSEFLASGSIGQLEFLGMVARTNPALQAQMAILSKTGGVMGGVISTQARLALGKKLLYTLTQSQLKQEKDLADVLKDTKQQFSFLRGEFGRFLGTALSPIIQKFNLLMFNLKESIDFYRQNSKHLLFLAKAMIVTAGAIGSVVGSLGTLRLLVKMLGFAGIGIPGLTFSLLALSAAFLGITQPVDGIMKKLELFGGFIKGVWELITNLDPETGLSKMSKSTYDMLQKAGLLEFAQTVGVLGSVMQRVAKDIYQAIAYSFKIVDDIFGGTFNYLFELFGNFTKNWDTWWTSDSIKGIDKVERAVYGLGMAIAGVLASMAAFKLFTGVMSKIPIIGKIFGGGGKGSGPSGTASDPIYTKSADIVKDIGKSGILDLLKTGAGSLFGQISKSFQAITMLLGFTLQASIPTILTTFGTALGGGIIALMLALAGAAGYAFGSILNSAFEHFFPDKTGSIDMSEDKTFQNATSQDAIAAHSKKMGWTGKSKNIENPNKVSPVVIPEYNINDEINKIDTVGSVLKETSGAQRAQTQAAIEAGLLTTSMQGKALSVDEMFNIMNPGISYLKQIADNTGKKEQNMSIPGPRRP